MQHSAAHPLEVKVRQAEAIPFDCVATECHASLLRALGFVLVGEAVTPWYPAAIYEKRLAL